MTYDQWKSTDDAGNDADVREAAPEGVDAIVETADGEQWVVEHKILGAVDVVGLSPLHLTPAECVCRRCVEAGRLTPPPASAYVCRHCGKAEEYSPYPMLGCWCLAATHVCDACLTAPRDRKQEYDK